MGDKQRALNYWFSGARWRMESDIRLLLQRPCPVEDDFLRVRLASAE
jgi:hypothetical protein